MISASFEEEKDTLAALSQAMVPRCFMVRDHSGRPFFWNSMLKVRDVSSDDEPPLLASVDGLWGELRPDFENILGIYDPDIYRITVFKKGVDWLADARTWHPYRLETIVYLHEWSHAVHHLGTDKWRSMKGIDVARGYAKRTARFRAIPDDLKEQIAQLCTLVAIRGQAANATHPKAISYFADVERIFFDLMASQSERYKLPNEIRAMDFHKLKAKLALLFRLTDNRAFPRLEDVAEILL